MLTSLNGCRRFIVIMASQYDVVIIGSGPAGYSAGITATRLGAKVCIVEKEVLGGVCVNKGCIPTKTILNTISIYQKLKRREEYGIIGDNFSIDYVKLLDRVKKVISIIKKGMEQVIQSNKIDLIYGNAELMPSGVISVDGKKIGAKKIIVCAGSRPKGLKDYPFDKNRILSSEEFLEIKELPKSVLIVGAGAIGCEWASILAGLGVSVTLVEALNKILPEEDEDLTRVLETNLKRMSVEIKLNTTVNKVSQEKVIICIGREPNTESIKGLDLKEGGWIKANGYMQTNNPDIYAVGDITGPPLLAYTAQREGMVAGYNALGKKMEMDYRFIPRVVFSMPEIASVGIREHEAEGVGISRAYFKGIGKALADNETDGFVKIIYDKKNLKILGVGIVGKGASELINEASVALRAGLTVREWADVVHPHPVLSEIFGAVLERIR